MLENKNAKKIVNGIVVAASAVTVVGGIFLLFNSKKFAEMLGLYVPTKEERDEDAKK